MIASEYNITIDRAAEYNFVLTIRDDAQQLIDLSVGTTFYSDIREVDSKKEAISFTPTVVTGSIGQVIFALSEADTLELNPSRSYEYDIFMKRNGSTRRLIFGSVIVRANITKGSPVDPTI